MIEYGKGRHWDQASSIDLGVSVSPEYRALSTPTSHVNGNNTARGTKLAWYDNGATTYDWHGFTLMFQNSWEPFFEDRKMSCDIAIGAVGSEQQILGEFCFDQPSHSRGSQEAFIPLFIPKGTTLHVRMMMYSNTTSGAFSMRPTLFGWRQDMCHHKVYFRSETIGISTQASPVLGNGYGTLVQPTIVDTMTPWVQIGENTFDYHTWYLNIGQGFIGIDPRITASAGPYNFLYEIGVGESGSQVAIIEDGYLNLQDSATGTSDWNVGTQQMQPLQHYLPAGTKIWARMQSSVISHVAAQSKDFRIVGFG